MYVYVLLLGSINAKIWNIGPKSSARRQCSRQRVELGIFDVFWQDLWMGFWKLSFGTIIKQKGCNANLANMKKTNIANKQKVQANFDKIAKTLKHLKLSFKFPMFEQHKQNDTELTTLYCVSPSSIDCVLMQRNCSLSHLLTFWMAFNLTPVASFHSSASMTSMLRQLEMHGIGIGVEKNCPSTYLMFRDSGDP